MNIFNKVTQKTLQKNRTRTIVTIIGIILSASMITAVTTFISSLLGYAEKLTIYQSGDWYGQYIGASNEGVDMLKADDRVNEVFISQDIGYSPILNPDNSAKPYIFVLGADAGFFRSMPVRLTEGRLPQNSSEIIIPEHLVSSGEKIKIGEVISLNLGKRVPVNQDTASGPDDAADVLWQNTPYQNSEGSSELLRADKTHMYTVVGICERPGFEPYFAAGYTALTVIDEKDSGSPVNIFFRTKYIRDTFDVMKSAGISFDCGQPDTNSDLLMIHGVSGYDNFLAVFYSFGAILIALIMFGSISLVSNAFAISVSERTKQFGLLSSIGATKKQLRASVLYEALFVSLIGIPFGILAGIAGIGVTLLCLSDSFGRIYYEGKLPFGFSLSVHPMAIIAAVIICLATVLISAWLPARRAAKVSAIDAIRQSADIKIKGKTVRTSNIITKLFGLPGMLARKNFNRNKKSYRATVISLFMSIVLFISASSFCEYLTHGVEGVENYVCDVEGFSYGTDLSAGKALYEKAKTLNNYTAFAYNIGIDAKIIADSSVFNADAAEKLASPEENGKLSAQAQLLIIDDVSYLEYLRENKLDPDKYYYSDKITPIICSSLTFWDYDVNKYVSCDIFRASSFDFTFGFGKDASEFSAGYGEGTNSVSPQAVEFRTGTLIKSVPWNLGTQRYSVLILLPARMAAMIPGENLITKGMYDFYYQYKTTDHEKLADDLKKLIMDSDFENYSLNDNVESMQTQRSMILIVKVFSYGFITLISLIAAANVFNTISTNIALRRREFAMLKSVGMTQSGFNKMMNFECLLYGIKALLWGLPASAVVTYLIYLSLMQGFETSFFIPWGAVLTSVLSVFAVVFATMLYSMRKIKKDNPIDALKNENL